MGYTPPAEIDIGNAAINRNDNADYGWTWVDAMNPANLSGKILKIAFYVDTALANVKVATFYIVSGSNFSTRDYETIANVPLGYSEHTVNLLVEAGDYIGLNFTQGDLSMDLAGNPGRYYKQNFWIPCTNETFVLQADRTLSIYGIGESGSGELTIGESCSVVDSKITYIAKALSEAFSAIDSWVARLNLSEAFGITDSIIKSAIKQLSETLNTVDSFAHTIILYFYETLSVMDSFVRNATKQLAEAVSIIDSKITKVVKALGEVFSVVDSFAHTIILYFYETLSTVDSLTKSATKQLAESFSVVDSLTKSVTKQLAEAFSVVDSFIKTIILHFYETLSVKDSFTTYLLSLWHKVIKGIANFIKVTKEKDDWTKVDKEKGDWNEEDKE